jgi:hypothetical protein
MRPRSQPKADIPPDIPKVEVSTPPTSTVTTDTNTNPALEAYQKEIERTDETAQAANRALLAQVEKLRESETLQRQWAAQRELERQQREAQIMAMKPPTLEQKMEWLKQSGVSIGDRQMVLETPGMLDHLEVADYAANQALQAGHQRDTDSYRASVRQNFQALMKHLQEEAAPVAGPFRSAPPPPSAPSPKANGAQYSAPISRDIPRGGDYVPSVPSRISLSAEERQIAAASGISDKEYAANKIRMMRMKATGEIQQ